MAMVEAARRTGRVPDGGVHVPLPPADRAVLELIARRRVGDGPADRRLVLVPRPVSGPGGCSIRPPPAAASSTSAATRCPTPARSSGAASGRAVRWSRPRSPPRGTLGPTGIDEWAVADLTFPGGVTASVRTGVRWQTPPRSPSSAARAPHLERPVDPAATEQRIVISTVDGERRCVEFRGDQPYAAGGRRAGSRCGGRRRGPSEMSLADSLGNAAVLDIWRAADRAAVPVRGRRQRDPDRLTGRPLQVRADAAMPYGKIAGLDKPVSRLVMGCDNQQTLAHASAMFDDFFAAGGNAFDTGYIYGGGLQERLLGQWIANRGIRDEVVAIGKGAHTPHCDPESITSQLTESLERLQHRLRRPLPDAPRQPRDPGRGVRRRARRDVRRAGSRPSADPTGPRPGSMRRTRTPSGPASTGSRC